MSRKSLFSVLLIIQGLCFVCGISNRICPCKVDSRTCSVNCSGLKLTNISEIISCVPNITRELDLTNNSLRYIEPEIFKTFISLEVLRLGYNNIEYLDSGTFEGLVALQELFLGHNILKHNDSYAVDVFVPLKNLRRLSLRNNCNAETSQCVYPDKALSAAKSVQYLHLDGFPEFGPGFNQLENLLSLYLGSSFGYCYITTLKENSFEPLRQTPLSYLELNGCSIRNLEPNVFRGIRNLTTLIILDNRKLCSDSIENATIGLNETNIETIRFNYWCRDLPTFITLSEGMLHGLTNTSLKNLDLGWNLINYVHYSCVNNLPKSLKYLSFKENKISNARFLKQLKNLDSLETIDVSYQNPNNIKGPLYRNITKFHLNLDYWQNIFKTKTKEVSLPENIRTIYMNDIKLKYPIPPLTFGSNKLQYLDSSGCMFTAFLGPWYGLTYLQFYDLSSNSFSLFSTKSLIDMRNLTTLLLHNNHIGDSLSKDTEGETFSSQKKLKVLNLSNNAIKNLPYVIFENQVSLENLSLADNSMKNVSFTLKSMKNLQFLDLSGNQIEYISSENMDFLDQIAATKDIHVNLSGNILSCMCDNQQFITWIATTKVHITDRNQLKCLYRNKTIVSLSMINLLRSQLEYECTLWIVMTSCIIGFVGFLLVFCIIALLYQKRWQLRYLWYIGRIKIDPFQHPDEQQSQLLQIDVYISYEQHYDVTDDVTLHQTVTDYMYPFFESRGYNVKIREEFEATDKLYHVIPESLRKCRKVVVLLTPSYCKDYWNTFEFNIAAFEGIYTKRNMVLPVLVGDTSDEHLTPEIRTFVRSKVKSKQVLRFPTGANCEHEIKTFNEELEYLLQQ